MVLCSLVLSLSASSPSPDCLYFSSLLEGKKYCSRWTIPILSTWFWALKKQPHFLVL